MYTVYTGVLMEQYTFIDFERDYCEHAIDFVYVFCTYTCNTCIYIYMYDYNRIRLYLTRRYFIHSNSIIISIRRNRGEGETRVEKQFLRSYKNALSGIIFRGGAPSSTPNVIARSSYFAENITIYTYMYIYILVYVCIYVYIRRLLYTWGSGGRDDDDDGVMEGIHDCSIVLQHAVTKKTF